MTKRPTSISHQPSAIRHPSESGVALILTLAILALVTLLLIAFVTSMRVENVASRNFNEVVRARELACGAIDQAVAQIRQATPIRGELPTPFYYVTGPGVIFTNQNTAYGPVYLFPGGANVVPTDTINSTNLNAGFWITGKNGGDFSVDANSAINVGWNYVGTNGVIGQSPLPGPGNVPIIGRYTYWVDDESAKIDINTAYQPALSPDPLGYSTNSQVDLNMLVPGLNNPAYLTAIHQRQASSGGPGFTTVEEVKIPDGSTAAATDFTNNQFYLTAQSDDAYYPTYLNTAGDFDVFERQRLLVSGLESPADIDGSGSNPRLTAFGRLSDNALKKVYSSSGTFLDKYKLAGLQQLIANIIAYQHDPLSATDPAPLPYDPAPGSDPPPYLGLCRAPYVNEVQVSYSATTPDSSGNFNLTRTVTVEMFYLYGADAPYTSGIGETLRVKNLPVITGMTPPMPSQVNIIIPAGTTFGTRAAAYQVVSSSAQFSGVQPPPTFSLAVPAAGSGTPATAPVVVDDVTRSGNRLDCAVLQAWPSFTIGLPLTSYYEGGEVNDPCLNENPAQWDAYQGTGSGGTLRLPNSNYAPPEPLGGNGIGDSKAHIRGSAMLSVGELGYIHLPFSSTAPYNAWGHLTLQPGGNSHQFPPAAGQIPDWAILDLFTTGGSTAGRMNINSYVWPGFPIATVRRSVPLMALLSGVFGAAGSVAPADQIYDNASVRMDNYGMQAVPGGSGRVGVFDTIGEVCEMPALTAGQTTQQGMEAAIRALANVITVRGNTFRIWVLAQSIKQPGGRLQKPLGQFDPTIDVITGDVKAEAVVERYENPPGTTPKYRLRYFRYLYN